MFPFPFFFNFQLVCAYVCVVFLVFIFIMNKVTTLFLRYKNYAMMMHDYNFRFVYLCNCFMHD
jgi:hypothetical protein